MPSPPAQLASIHVYPIKSCAAVTLEHATLGAHGLAGDREWMVARADGRFLSQRNHPRLARVRPMPTATGLRLEAPGVAPLTVDLAQVLAGPERAVTVWDEALTGFDAGDAAACWLEGVIGTALRLIRVAPTHLRRADHSYVGERDVPVAFADGYPVLVTSSASLEELNRRMPVAVPMDRFRANLVLEGLAAFAEDGVHSVRIGAVTLEFVKPCTRCSVPGIDQTTGEPSTDPFPALKAFRYDRALRGVTFGVNAVASAPPGARLEVGMPVTILG